MIDKIVDIYHNDNVLHEDFAAVAKGGVPAVIHKASQGITSHDPRYASRRIKAVAAGLLWGAYHFGTSMDGTAQADWFLSQSKPDAHTLIALDLEHNPTGPTIRLRQAQDFVNRIYAKLGRYPWVYGSDLLTEFAGAHGDPVLAKCPLWIARYSTRPPVVPPGWGRWLLWQYTAGESASKSEALPGLGLVDRSQFAGTLDELKAVWAA